jgi:hypothetical protein
VVEVPVTLVVGNEGIGGFVLGSYHETTYVPSFSGGVSHEARHSLFSVTASEGVYGGNGYYLASRNIFVNGVYSYSWRAQNISFGGSFIELKSVANAATTQYTGGDFSASYGRGLVRHVGMFLRYDLTYYGGLPPYNGLVDNRIAFGFNFSSKSIPMTLF